MDGFLSRVPGWALAALLIYLAVLVSYAVWDNRQVDFWPPKIYSKSQPQDQKAKKDIDASASMLQSDVTAKDSTIFNRVEGKWDWTKSDALACSENFHEISFSHDRTSALFKYNPPFERNGKMVSSRSYTVLYAEGNKIAMLMDDELRRTAQGDRVIWVLTLSNPHTYYWRRTDWAANEGTRDIQRCK
jgi:hypothetical protein